MVTFSDILDEDLLMDLAGDRSFERGLDYFEGGLMYSLAQYDEHITAQVYGTQTYRVDLWLQDDDLRYDCTCPMGEDGWFCKHCVAVGLAWIAEPPPYRPASDVSATPRTTMENLRDYLARQERETLVGIILDQAMEDARWREQLLLKAASRQTGGANINTFRQALRNAIAIGDFVDYHAAAGYADDVQSVLDGLEELVLEISREQVFVFREIYLSKSQIYYFDNCKKFMYNYFFKFV